MMNYKIYDVARDANEEESHLCNSLNAEFGFIRHLIDDPNLAGVNYVPMAKTDLERLADYGFRAQAVITYLQEKMKEYYEKNSKFIPGNRVGIKEDPKKAGVIEVRPGTHGLTLGNKKYAMAYIRVLDENHYLKGMCIYSDSLPEGYDVIKYCLSPSACLKALVHAPSGIIMNKGILTKVMSDAECESLLEELHSDRKLDLPYRSLKECKNGRD